MLTGGLQIRQDQESRRQGRRSLARVHVLGKFLVRFGVPKQLILARYYRALQISNAWRALIILVGRFSAPGAPLSSRGSIFNKVHRV